MWNFSTSNQFPEIAEYIEKLIPNSIDEPITSAGSIQYAFRAHTDNRGFAQPLPGLRTNKRIQYKIETKADLPFKAGDIVRFELNDSMRYTITNIEYGILNENEYIFVNQAWPGFAKDAVKVKIITLE
jgi:hypothetical protein